MAGSPGWFKAERAGDELRVSAGGDWTINTLVAHEAELTQIVHSNERAIRFDLSGIDRLDTASAWAIQRTLKALQHAGRHATLTAMKPQHLALLRRVAESTSEPMPDPPQPGSFIALLERLGKGAIYAKSEAIGLVAFLGLAVITIGRVIAHPAKIRVVSWFSHLERVGVNAMPIVGLLSFLVGVVIAYQGADQLRRFGADIFMVNLLGITTLRELGVLLTAIIIAGRSGSAFTAQIGTMQVNEEVDAIRALGLDPVEILVLPRLFALVVALPLLTVFADFMALLGGLVIGMTVLDISAIQFLTRLNTVVSQGQFWVGMVKAPVFGFLIAMIGCREGLNTGGSAESVGLQTTKSVVVSIFLVIVVDAVFSVFFSYIGV
jgi:phospholipid/cholesterol/gamma-HCH transport system permease protein